MKIAHFADVHFRGLARHDEYRHVFSLAFDKLKKLNPDVIYIGGDIVHSKTQGITPELIDILTWWFTCLSEIAPVDVILGNHDGLLLNKDRQDAITPVINALNNPRIRLFKKSGVYDAPVQGFKWCVFSPFDETSWPDVKPERGSINIALYHGAVRGSKSDSDYELEGEVSLDLFEKFDFGMFGDIHRRQFLNDAETIAYCGSTIQQNYGEDLDKGFLFWDITSKNKFKTSFHAIDNPYSYVNVDWQGNVEDTIKLLTKASEKSRVRFSVPRSVSDVDTRALYESASKSKSFTEIVFKGHGQNEVETLNPVAHIKSENLRDKNTVKKVIENYLLDKNTDSEKIRLALDEFDKYYDSVIIDDEIARNVQWSLKRLQFDNVFAYGKKNEINFENLSGITGIFGRNRTGKSSIIGTIVYALFNTSDRGAMKNLHIINADSESCKAKIDLAVSGEDYEITRESTKNYPKRGEVWANTTLSLKKKSTGDVTKDLNDEQRRETEKVVRKLIGTSDDFFYTCLAPQGQMNMFINEKSTSRKQILSRFLDLEIFDKYFDAVKQDLGPIKSTLKASSSIDVLTGALNDLMSEKSALEENANSAATRLSHLRNVQATLGMPNNENIVTTSDINSAQSKADNLEKDIEDLTRRLEEIRGKIESYESKVKKVRDVLDEFSIDDLRKRQTDLNDLEMKFAINLKDLESKDREIEALRKRIKILDEVPCGDSFPSCVFIKDAHDSKKVLSVYDDSRSTIQRTLDILQEKIGELNHDDIKAKIDKMIKLGELENDLKIKIVEHQSQEKITESKIESKRSLFKDAIHNLDVLKSKKETQDNQGQSENQRRYIEIKNEISDLEKKSLNIAASLGRNDEKRTNTEQQIKNLKTTIERYEILSLLETSFSKKGIPQNIVSKSLPLINTEISKILSGIAGFTVEIECDDSNSIEIYINYGDRRRIIELGSGMEKMIASIAIRVALTNISSLPKSDMLIIDEGFGVLDDSNLESCARLLQNLKSYFRNILVISHVDAIKDIVDNILSIDTHDGKARVSHV